MNTGKTQRFLSGSARQSVIPYVHLGVVLIVEAWKALELESEMF
jgi:extradiol dioxygenase family protein